MRSEETNFVITMAFLAWLITRQDEIEKQKLRVTLNRRIKHLFNKNKMEAKLLDSLESEMQDIDLLFERLTRAKKEE